MSALVFLGLAQNASADYRSTVLSTSGLTDYWRLDPEDMNPEYGSAVLADAGAGGYPQDPQPLTPGAIKDDLDPALDTPTGGIRATGQGLQGTFSTYTINLWLRPPAAFDGNPDDGYLSYDGLIGPPDTRKFISAYVDTDGKPVCRISIDGANSSLKGASVLPRDKWSMLSCTRDMAGTLSLYVNGVSQGSLMGSVSPVSITGSVQLGYGGYGNSPTKMDEVSTWNRPLDSTELNALFAAGTADTSAPDTAVTDGPADNSLLSAGPSYTAASSQPDDLTTYQCATNLGTGWYSCAFPYTVPVSGEGSYRLRTRAVDRYGRADSTPVTRGFLLDQTAPSSGLSTVPSLFTSNRRPALGFTATDALAPEQLSNTSFEGTTSGWAASTAPNALAPSSYTLSSAWSSHGAQSLYLAGTMSIAGRLIEILRWDPTPVVAGVPYRTSVDLNVLHVDSPGQLRLKINWFNADYTYLSADQLILSGTGLQSPSLTATAPAGARWASPLVTFYSASTAPTFATYIDNFGFRAAPLASGQCRIDGGGWQGCSSPFSPSADLDPGPHQMQVRSIDGSGNQSSDQNADFTVEDSYRSMIMDTSGLVSYWPLDETTGSIASDLKGMHTGNHTAVTLNRPALVSDSRPAVQMGTGSTIAVGDQSAHRFSATSPFTVEAWVRPTLIGGTYRAIVSKWASNVGWSVAIAPSGAVRVVRDNFFSLVTPQTLQTGRIYHVAVTYDSSTVQIYIDGVLAASAASSTSAATNTSSLALGKSTFEGQMDEVAIYDRALSGTEISNRYQAGKGSSSSPVIASAPSLLHASSQADFSLLSPDDYLIGFECLLDAGPWAPCSAMPSFPSLSDGPHTFSARAVSGWNTIGPAVSHSFTVDTVAPSVALLSAPEAQSPNSTATLSFATTETGSGLQCRLDQAPWQACTSPVTLSDLPDGMHQFSIRATDPTGNQGAVLTHEWQVIARPPKSNLSKPVPRYLSAESLELHFTADQQGTTFRCRLDDQPWRECNSPMTWPVDEGPHSAQVQATSPQGTVEPDPLVVSVMVDRSAPDTAIERAPPQETLDNGYQVQLSSNEEAVRFECSLNQGPWEDCASEARRQGLSSGEQTLAARAVDRAGNADPEPALTQWLIQGNTVFPRLRSLGSRRQRLECDLPSLPGMQAITYHWTRDDRTIRHASGPYYKLGSADDEKRLRCVAKVTFVSGTTRTLPSGPVLIMGPVRLSDYRYPARVSKRLPRISYRLNRPSLVLVRLWCRSRDKSCRKPSLPLDYILPVSASYIPADLTKYRRIISSGKAGLNHLDLNRVLRRQLPSGEYKLTIRLARRQGARRHRTSTFLARSFVVRT